jgi:hypothetical protein
MLYTNGTLRGSVRFNPEVSLVPWYGVRAAQMTWVQGVLLTPYFSAKVLNLIQKCSLEC